MGRFQSKIVLPVLLLVGVFCIQGCGGKSPDLMPFYDATKKLRDVIVKDYSEIDNKYADAINLYESAHQRGFLNEEKKQQNIDIIEKDKMEFAKLCNATIPILDAMVGYSKEISLLAKVPDANKKELKGYSDTLGKFGSIFSKKAGLLTSVFGEVITSLAKEFSNMLVEDSLKKAMTTAHPAILNIAGLLSKSYGKPYRNYIDSSSYYYNMALNYKWGRNLVQ